MQKRTGKAAMQLAATVPVDLTGLSHEDLRLQARDLAHAGDNLAGALRAAREAAPR